MREYITYEWFTVSTILGIALIAAAKFVNSLRFADFLSVVGNSKYLKIYGKDQKFIDGFDSLLFLNLVISSSIFIYFGYNAFFEPIDFELIGFLKLLFAVSAIILIKTLIERLIGSLFEIDSLIDGYLFQKTTFKNFSGLIFIVANLFLLYTDNYLNIIIIASLCVVCLINFIGFLTSFRNYQKLINPNFFYFLLYLCALEIGPYVLLFKAFRGYNA